MVAGSLVDLIGPRRVLAAGTGAVLRRHFAAAGAVFWMDVLRLVQAAARPPSPPPCPRWRRCTARRARAFSLLGTTFGIGLFGPLASGWLVEAAGWHWVFLATGLVGLLGAALVAASVRAAPAGMRGRLDWRARCASPARWACSPAACCWRPKPAGAVPAYWARCWHLPCWPWPARAAAARALLMARAGAGCLARLSFHRADRHAAGTPHRHGRPARWRPASS